MGMAERAGQGFRHHHNTEGRDGTEGVGHKCWMEMPEEGRNNILGAMQQECGSLQEEMRRTSDQREQGPRVQADELERMIEASVDCQFPKLWNRKVQYQCIHEAIEACKKRSGQQCPNTL